MTQTDKPTLPVTQRMARLIPQPLDSPSAHQDVVHISSFAIIRPKEEKGKLLLTKRIKPQFTAGKWILPSSIIDYGEDPEGAISRILEVQLGRKPKEVRLLQVQSYGGNHWDICFVYEANFGGDNFGTLSHEIEKAEFFDLKKLPSELRADHKEVLENVHLI